MLSSSSVVLTIPTTTAPVRVARLRKLPASVDQATMTLAGSSAALPVSARYSDFVRAPMGPIERSSGHGAWKAEVSAALDVGESWNLGVFLAHALKAHGLLQEQHSDVPGDAPRAVWATGAVDVIDLRILPVGHIETKLRQALGATPVPDLFLLPPDNLGDVPAELRAELEARGTRIIAPATMSEALEVLGLPSDWAKEAAPDLAGWRGDPYRGLEAYEAEHRPIFFGRASARTEALERLRTRAERGTSLLVIHGKSGVGKSSLAMAGLLDDVVEQVPGRAPFGTATIRFGDGSSPLVALRAGFAQALGLEEASTLQSSSAAEWLKSWPENSEPRTLLLILDQLEQALLADEVDTIAFGEAIATLVQTGRVWVIATLRSDRIDLLERAPALAEMADGDALYRLVRPTLAELGEIIRAPAKLAGIAFEEGNGADLVNLLAEEAMRAPDSLPLLQVTLMRLAAQRDADGRVGMRDYERIGGFSGAVGRLADETVRKMEAEGIDGNVVDRTLVSLVRIDSDTDRVDARVVDPDAQTAEIQHVLSALVEARLATASTVSEALDPDTERGSVESSGPNDSGRRVRLAHETLIREWPRLHDLAARLRSELSLRDRLEDDAVRWDQDGRPQGDLIRTTARLTAAEALVADGLATPSPQAQTYIEASRTEVERQAEQRRAAADKGRRRLVTRMAIAMVIVTLLGGVAWFQRAEAIAQRDQAQITQSEFLTDQAQVLFNQGYTAKAIEILTFALPRNVARPERPWLERSFALLAKTMVANRVSHIIRRDVGAPYTSHYFDNGTKIFIGYNNGDMQIVDVIDGSVIKAVPRTDYVQMDDPTIRLDVLESAGLVLISVFGREKNTTLIASLVDLSIKTEIKDIYLATPFDIGPQRAGWSANENFLVYMGTHDNVIQMDLRTFETKELFSIRLPDHDGGLNRSVGAIAISNDGQTVVVGAGWSDVDLVFWNSQMDRSIILPVISDGGGIFSDDVSALKIDQDHGYIFAGTKDGTLHAYQLLDGSHVGSQKIAPGEILHITQPSRKGTSAVYYVRDRGNQRGGNLVFTRMYDQNGQFQGLAHTRSDQNTLYAAAICDSLDLAVVAGAGHLQFVNLWGDERMTIIDGTSAFSAIGFDKSCTSVVASEVTGANEGQTYIMQVSSATLADQAAVNPLSEPSSSDLRDRRAELFHSEDTGINGSGAIFQEGSRITKTAITYFLEDDKELANTFLGVRDILSGEEYVYRLPDVDASPGYIDTLNFVDFGRGLLMSKKSGGRVRWWLMTLETSDPVIAPLDVLNGASSVYVPPSHQGTVVFTDPETMSLVTYDLLSEQTNVLIPSLAREANEIVMSEDRRLIVTADDEAVMLYRMVGDAIEVTDLSSRMGPFAGQPLRELALSESGRFLAVRSTLEKNNRYRDEVGILDLGSNMNLLSYDAIHKYRPPIGISFSDSDENLIVTNDNNQRFEIPLALDQQNLLDSAYAFVAENRPLSSDDRCELHISCQP